MNIEAFLCGSALMSIIVAWLLAFYGQVDRRHVSTVTAVALVMEIVALAIYFWRKL